MSQTINSEQFGLGYITLSCDGGCGTEQTFQYSESNLKEAMQQAREAGWKFSFDEDTKTFYHYCSKC